MRELLESFRCGPGKRYRKTKDGLVKLAKQQRFDLITDILCRNDCSVESWLNDSSDEGESALHTVLKYRAPLQVIEALIQKLLEHSELVVPEEALDNEGKTPLHVAAEKGCDSAVITRLLQGPSGTDVASSKDVFGRYPLHWACDSLDGRCKRRLAHAIKDVENGVRIVLILISAFPSAASVPDHNGYSPVHLAMLHRADKRIIKALSLATACHKRRPFSPHAIEPVPSKTEETEQSSSTAEFPVPHDIHCLGPNNDNTNDDLSSIGFGDVVSRHQIMRNRRASTRKENRYNFADAAAISTFGNDDMAMKQCWFM